MLFKEKFKTTKYFEQIIALEGKVFGRDLDNIYQNDEEIMVIYQMDNEKIIGYITYKEHQESFDVYMIAVHPNYQKQGIATRLIAKLKNEQKNIILEVESTNVVAINLYYQQGFKTIRDLKNYYKGKPGLFLEWRAL